MSSVEQKGAADASDTGGGDHPRRAATIIPGGAQARLVLALVVVFTVAFLAVILMKLQRERQDVTAQARATFATELALEARETAARVALARGALIGAANAMEIDARDPGGLDVTAHLSRLAARSDMVNAALADGSGGVRAVTDAAMEAQFASALALRRGRSVWSAPGVGADSALYLAADAALPGGPRIVLAQLSADALLRDSDAAKLADVSGRWMTSAPWSGPDVRRVLDRARSDGVSVVSVAGADGTPRAVGAALVPGAEAFVIHTDVLRENLGLWRRTLAFYLLLLLAPVLVALGLCAVLLMQMDNVRQTRVALLDSEKRFRLAVEGARCGVWDWDVRRGSVYITESLARMLGRRSGTTLSSDDFLSLIRREDQDKVNMAVQSASTTGEVDVEFRAVGLPMCLHARGRPWSEISGRPTGRVVGVAIDVTEQRGAQQRVLKAETQLRHALESMSESFALWDSRRRLVTSNPKFRDFFHLDDKLVKRGASYDMLELAARNAIKAVNPGPRADTSELELLDGRWIHLSERETADGGRVSIGTEISELKRSQEMLRENERKLRATVAELSTAQQRMKELAQQREEQRARAEEASRSKSEFLANMSHELRTPLNAINGFSEIMQQEMWGPLGDERYMEYVGDILSSGQLLLQLINDILDMSKIEAGKHNLSYERVFPDEIADQCARLVRGRAKENGLELKNNVDDMPEIQADPRALKQILLNLLSNAVKFTPRGGSVEMRGFTDDTGVAMQVIDTGIGISRENLDRIGKPFEQIESHQAKTHQGSGLGLALSKSLAGLHRGHINIESEEGVGTVVTVWIPRSPPAELEDEDEPALANGGGHHGGGLLGGSDDIPL